MRIKRLCNAKKGFSLIEVIIALAILMIVVLGLLTSYYSYYRNVTDLRIQTIGQNLAQLQLEDVQNLSISALGTLIGGGSYLNYPTKLIVTLPPPLENKYYNDYGGFAYENIYDSIQYGPYPKTGDPETYFPQGGSFMIEHLTDICGKTGGTLPELLLPSSIEVERVPATGTFIDYTLILHKEVFPSYKKRVIIIDKTPSLDQKYKIFGIEVTVYWDVNGVEKSITVTGEKSYARSS